MLMVAVRMVIMCDTCHDLLLWHEQQQHHHCRGRLHEWVVMPKGDLPPHLWVGWTTASRE